MAVTNKIFVVIPSYNESEIVAETVDALRPLDYQIIVVDDGSDEEKSAILATINGIHLLRHVINLGQGAALQTGVRYALGQGADVIIHHDADGQHDPDDFGGLLAPILAGEADIVLGSRFLRKEDLDAVPPGRKILLRAAVVINGLFTGLWLSDAHNGARAMNRKAAESIQLKENGFAHATEILLEIKNNGLRYMEGPTRISYTEYSLYKGQKASNAINIFIDLVIRRFFG